MEEFGRAVSRQEVYRQLDARRRRPGESIRRFVMDVESIGRRAGILDPELLPYIQEGLAHNSPEYNFFITARSMEMLKDMVSQNEQREAIRTTSSRTRTSSSPVEPKR